MSKQKRYEIMVIVSPQLTEAEVGSLYDEIKAQLGEVIYEEIWGKKKFAYPIKKFKDGFYALWNFHTSVEKLSELRGSLNLNQNVLRHMVVIVPEDYKPLTQAEMEEGIDAFYDEKKEKREKKAAKRGGVKGEKKEKEEKKEEKPAVEKTPAKEVVEEVIEEKVVKEEAPAKEVVEEVIEEKVVEEKAPVEEVADGSAGSPPLGEVKTEEVKVEEAPVKEKEELDVFAVKEEEKEKKEEKKEESRVDSKLDEKLKSIFEDELTF